MQGLIKTKCFLAQKGKFVRTQEARQPEQVERSIRQLKTKQKRNLSKQGIDKSRCGVKTEKNTSSRWHFENRFPFVDCFACTSLFFMCQYYCQSINVNYSLKSQDSERKAPLKLDFVTTIRKTHSYVDGHVFFLVFCFSQLRFQRFRLYVFTIKWTGNNNDQVSVFFF